MLWLMRADLRRERIGMIFGIDSSTGAATRTDRRRLFHVRQMSGGKGGKGGNLESLGNMGLADDVTKRRKLAETGGTPFLGPCSGAQVFLERLRDILGSLAEIAETHRRMIGGKGGSPFWGTLW